MLHILLGRRRRTAGLPTQLQERFRCIVREQIAFRVLSEVCRDHAICCRGRPAPLYKLNEVGPIGRRLLSARLSVASLMIKSGSGCLQLIAKSIGAAERLLVGRDK